MARVLGFQVFGAVLALLAVAGLVDVDRYSYATGWLIWISIGLLGMIVGGQIGSAAPMARGTRKWKEALPKNGRRA
jgi:hypothetical protein